MDWKTISNMDVYTDAERDRAQRDNIALNSTPLQPSDLPQEILARLQPHYSNWSMQDNSVNYRELRKSDSVMLFEKQGKDWVSVQSFTGTVVMGETAYAVSRRSLRQTPRGGGSGRGMDAGPATLAAANSEEPQLVPAVLITSPSNGSSLKLTDKKHITTSFKEYTFKKGDTVNSVVKNLTGQDNPSAILNYNPPFSEKRLPQEGDPVRVAVGQALMVKGGVTNTGRVNLSWKSEKGSNGSQSSSVRQGEKNQSVDWEIKIDNIQPGDYTLTAQASNAKHETRFTIVSDVNTLPLALSAYTVEQIDRVKSVDSSRGARDAPANITDMLKEQDLPYTDMNVMGEAGGYAAAFGTDTHIPQSSIDELKSRLISSGSGDYRLYYSGNGDRAFIEKRIDKIFGKHLGAQTREALISKLEKTTQPTWIDTTDVLHEAYNNTLKWVFKENPQISKAIQTTINSNLEAMKYADVGYDGYMHGSTTALAAALTTQDIFLNTQLAQDSTGAPEHMQREATLKVFVFSFVMIMGTTGVALNPAIKATRATKGYFKKYQHRFKKKQNFIKRENYDIDSKKFDYFYGNVEAPDPALKQSNPKKFKQLDHNYKRSQQMKKTLESEGMGNTPKGREKLLNLFDNAAKGPEISRHVGDYGTTITRTIETPNVKYEVKYFYENGDLNLKPKVTTMIPKVKR